jgi:hypothetical protein
MSEIVNGFIVVRCPENNHDFEKSEYLRHESLHINGTYYGGVDRMRWFEIEENYYNGLLQIEIEALWSKLRTENTDFTGIVVSKSLDEAKKLLNYSNLDAPLNEMIVVHSDCLNNKGEFFCDEVPVVWLGYDPFSIGYWSLLSEGLFVVQEPFKKYIEDLNDFGLFSRPEDALEYSESYLKESSKHTVEELPDGGANVVLIRVGRFQ